MGKGSTLATDATDATAWEPLRLEAECTRLAFNTRETAADLLIDHILKSLDRSDDLDRVRFVDRHVPRALSIS